MSGTEETGLYHCPECGFEWDSAELGGGSPPYPHCPECGYGMLREGPAEDESDASSVEIDELLKQIRQKNEAWKAFLGGYSYGYNDGSEPRQDFDERAEFRDRVDELFEGYYDD